MDPKARILIATDNATDGNLVRRLLSIEFDNVTVSAYADRHLADFERCKPEVLVLAFDSLEKAERYYLGLYRLSTVVHALPHRTLILCNQDDLKQGFELCKKQHFDDYILFWPMVHDTPRLPMAVIHALRQMEESATGAPLARELAAQARRIAELEALLAEHAAQGERHLRSASSSLQQAASEMGAALSGLSHRVAHGGFVEVRDAGGLAGEFERFQKQEVGPRFASLHAAVKPLDVWIDSLDQIIAPQLDAVRELQAVAERVSPLLLIVDDDPLQREVLGQLLEEASVELMFAASGTEALRAAHRRPPDLVLMDVNLPDMDGIETMRRLHGTAYGSRTPVIMITGYSQKDVVVESRRAGAADFVVKPYDRAVLLDKVRAFLRR